MNLSRHHPRVEVAYRNLNVTVSLALIRFHLCPVSWHPGERPDRYFEHFVGEPAWMAPLNIPITSWGAGAAISLALNVSSATFSGEDPVVAILIMLGASFYLPIQFRWCCWAIFTSFVQAIVFTMLDLYLYRGVRCHDDHGHGHDHGHHDHGRGEEHGAVHDSRVPAPPA